jgi:hypothetical protein
MIHYQPIRPIRLAASVIIPVCREGLAIPLASCRFPLLTGTEHFVLRSARMNSRRSQPN